MSDQENPYAGNGPSNYSVSFGEQEEKPASQPPQATGSAPFQPLQSGAPASGGQSVPVKDITTAEFVPEVIEDSKTMPVMVDFWAPWCGPCKQLAPALEKVAAEFTGQVKLVKMNIDEHPEISGQMGIKSIPAVVAFKDGKPAEAFMGAQPESTIREFVLKLLDGAGQDNSVETFLQDVQVLIDNNEMAQAMEALGTLLQQDPQNTVALAMMGSAYLMLGDEERARAVADTIDPQAPETPQLTALRAELELLAQAEDLGDLNELMAKAAADANDFQAHYDLAIALNAAGKREEATDALIHVIRTKRDWNEEAARKQLLQFFEAWGPMDEATSDGRRKLSSALFS